MTGPMPLADYVAPQCKCGHMHRDHVHGGKCLVDGCGCTEFRARDESAFLTAASELLDRAEREARAEAERRGIDLSDFPPVGGDRTPF